MLLCDLNSDKSACQVLWSEENLRGFRFTAPVNMCSTAEFGLVKGWLSPASLSDPPALIPSSPATAHLLGIKRLLLVLLWDEPPSHPELSLGSSSWSHSSTQSAHDHCWPVRANQSLWQRLCLDPFSSVLCPVRITAAYLADSGPGPATVAPSMEGNAGEGQTGPSRWMWSVLSM